MGKCIICNQEKNDLTTEHIIPYALGNRGFVINCVCKDCNSKLGDKLDSYVSNSFIANIFREQHGLKGQSGKVPVALDNGELPDGTKVTRKNGKFVSKTRVKIDDKKIQVSAPSLDESIRIVNGILQKRGRKLSKEEYNSFLCNQKTAANQEICFHVEIDINIFIIDLLKIILETYVFFYGIECVLDDELGNIRKLIYNYIYSGELDDNFIDSHCFSMNEESVKLFKVLEKEISKTCKNDVVHALAFIKTEEHTVVMTWVQGMLPFVFKIKVSEKYPLNKMILISKDNGLIEL